MAQPVSSTQVDWLQSNSSQEQQRQQQQQQQQQQQRQQQQEAFQGTLETLATTVSAKTLFMPPGRATRPRLIAVLLRGLPGSGKTRVAQALRDAEVECGGAAPKIHSLDDYFMTEVEKVVTVEEELANGRVTKRQKKVMEMEYEFESELEEAYKASLLKGLKRTAEEARFQFVIGARILS